MFKKKTTPQSNPVPPEMADCHPTATQAHATNTVNVHEDAVNTHHTLLGGQTLSCSFSNSLYFVQRFLLATVFVDDQLSDHSNFLVIHNI